jgi:hypothetical protein
MAFHLDEEPVLHADQPRQLPLALVRIGEFEQHGRLPVAAVGHQGRIGVDLGLDAGLVEDLLDVQHLLDLATDRLLVLELQRQVLAQVHAAQAAVGDHRRLAGLADLGIRLQRQQGITGDGHGRRG